MRDLPSLGRHEFKNRMGGRSARRQCLSHDFPPLYWRQTYCCAFFLPFLVAQTCAPAGKAAGLVEGEGVGLGAKVTAPAMASEAFSVLSHAMQLRQMGSRARRLAGTRTSQDRIAASWKRATSSWGPEWP